MFIVKKSMILVLAAVVVFGLSFGIYGQLEYGVNASMPTIVIDAGHGGIDAGVLGIETGTKESEINLAVSKYLRGYFTDAGFNTVLTRKTQGGLYGLPTSGFKSRDMKARKKIIEECNADMVISVHQNYFSNKSRRGAQVFYDASSECGKKLALCIQSCLNDMEGNAGEHAPLAGDYFMLKCTESPSVIVECGFLSNAEDEALLITSRYQKLIAYTIFKGAISYYA